MTSRFQRFLRPGQLATWGIVAALCLLGAIAAQQARAWDAGTESRAHKADASTGGENMISILDTRPKWAESVGANSSRVSDCPPGYTNNGVTCGRGADTLSAPSLLATCPAGFTNTGVSCYREPYIYAAASQSPTCPAGYAYTGVSCYREPFIYAAASQNPNCPAGYAYTGVSCYREPFIYSAPSKVASCPSGYTNTGVSCYRGPDSYARTYGASCSGTNIGLICSGGSFSCPRGGSLTAGVCYLTCASGYSNTGLTCLRPASTLSLNSASCPSGYFKGALDRCYQTCNSGFTNTGEFCNRGPDTVALSSAAVTCSAGYAKGLTGRCNKVCDAGFTNTGEFCQRDADTIALSNASVTCSAGYFKGLTGRCNQTCPAGFTNTGEFCQRDEQTLALAGNATCPGGYFLGTFGRCNKACPAGYTNTGETCFLPASTLTASSMSCYATEELITVAGIPRCYSKPVCPTGYGYFGLRCYVTAGATGLGASVERTAVSTIVHNVRQSGNTHLWVVNQALDLLQKEDPLGLTPLGAFVNELRTSAAVRQQWEQGLWDADTPAYADADGHQGTHFYNAAKKDRNGAFTPFDTYFPAFDNKFACKNARACAAAQLTNVAGFKLGDTNPLTKQTAAYHLGLALHYMTDATQPMHTSGWSGADIPTNGHPQWEYYVPQIQHLFTVNGQARNPRFLDWQGQGINLDNPNNVFHQAALKSNSFAPRLAAALNVDGGAGIVTIQGFNGIGPYTGYNFYNDQAVDKLTGEILQDAYQSTAAYLAAVWKTYFQVALRRTCDVDGNGVIDRLDLNAIMAGRNTPASGATDARDADGNGSIDANDARQCVLRCTFANCASANR